MKPIAINPSRCPRTARFTVAILSAFVIVFLGLFASLDAREKHISQDEFQKSLFVVTTGDVGAKVKGEVKPGDRLISIDGQPVHDSKDVREAVQQAGEKAAVLTLERPAENGFQNVTVEITPGDEHKLGIGFLKAHEVQVFSPENESVVLAESPARIEKERSGHKSKTESAGDLLLLDSGTKVLAVSKLRTILPWTEVYLTEGAHKGEIWYVKSESVKPKSYKKRGISWFFYLAVLASIWWLMSMGGRRNVFGVLALLAIGTAARLTNDMVEPPLGMEVIWKFVLQGGSLICQLTVFFFLSKWSKEDKESGDSSGGAGLIGIALLMFMPLLLVAGTVYNFFREIGQPKTLPASTLDDVSRSFQSECEKHNRKQKDPQNHLLFQGQSIKYKETLLRWTLEKRFLHLVAAAPGEVESLLRRAVETGEDSKYELGEKAVYINAWKGFISKKGGNVEVLWGDVSNNRELAEEVVYEFIDRTESDLEVDDDTEDSDFEEWLQSPDWKPIESFSNGAWPPGFDQGVVTTLNQVCAGRNAAVSESGVLISLEAAEKISEALPQGPGQIAIVYHGYPELIRELASRLNPLGFKIVVHDLSQEKLLIYKNDDQYHCLRLQGHIAYHSASSVIRKLKEWDENYDLNLRVVGFGSDWVDAEIDPPQDLVALSGDILRFCPDILEQEMDPLKVLVEELGESKRIHLWWD